MNNQQAQNILEQAQQFEFVNLDEFISRTYPDRSDLENIQLSSMSLYEFLYLFKKIMAQFVLEFSSRENTLILPHNWTHPTFGAAQVDSQIQNLYTYINANNISHAENILLWLVAYQVDHGFYNRPNKKSAEVVSGNLNRLSEQLNLIEKSIENKLKEVNSLFTSIENTKIEIQNLITQKREELTQITNNLATSNTNANQIAELLNKGTDQSSRLNTLLEQQEQNKTISDKRLTELQDLYTTTNDKLSDNIKAVVAQLELFKEQVISNKEHLTFVESKREFFEERIKYLDNLIGREVGASLFETFKQRKMELNTPVWFWRIIVPVMSIVTVLWVFYLFKSQSEIKELSEWWQAFALNTLKTIPAIFLLLFSINQYRKERNFQEEYAFKSAVALTIDAFANRIKNEGSRDQLIKEAVLGVYSTPIEEKQHNKPWNKSTTEMMKTMLETTRDLIKPGK